MPPVRYHEGGFPPPADAIDWRRLIPLIGPAHDAIARYDGVLAALPNAQVLLSPLTTQEAVLSSRIEGTQATMGEVLEYEAGGGPDPSETKRVEDIQLVVNYRKAMWRAREELRKVPLSGRVLCAAHAELLAGVRGQERRPGEYRAAQNWIGPDGSTPETARFVPIPQVYLHEGIGRWENYLHSDQPDLLVQLAIVHAEFEAIHPFADGNGRLGRMLIPLFLLCRKVLSEPTFYISAYLEARRGDYYDQLLAVSRDGDWTGWCEFFLRALVAQADSNTAKSKEILRLYEAKKDWIMAQARSAYAIRVLDFIFNRPVFKSSDFVSQAEIPRRTAFRILPVLKEGGLLRELRAGIGPRPAILVFPELLNIVEGRQVF